MRSAFLLVTLLGFAEPTFVKAQTNINTVVPASGTAAGTRDSKLFIQEPGSTRLILSERADTNSVDYAVGKKTTLHLSGPVATTLKSKSTADFSHRLLGLLNPFSSAAPNVPAAPSGPVNTRAWSTIVGWSPGQSAFQDEHYHEPPQLRLISASIEKQP